MTSYIAYQIIGGKIADFEVIKKDKIPDYQDHKTKKFIIVESQNLDIKVIDE